MRLYNLQLDFFEIIVAMFTNILFVIVEDVFLIGNFIIIVSCGYCFASACCSFDIGKLEYFDQVKYIFKIMRINSKLISIILDSLS